MLEQAKAIQTDLVRWRRAIHRQPEIGFHVYKTAELVAGTLHELGVEVQSGVGKSGVVARLGDGDGPVIAVRADMDALPIQESNHTEYASQVSGVMHACGHDAHTAMLLGAAKLLSQLPIHGEVRLLFQPSEENFDEEGISGAPRMIADGALEGVDAVIALHVDGTLETGKITIGSGPVGAAVDTFKIHVTGRGGHGAYPHRTVDPIWLSSHVLSALYAIPSRQIAPLQPSVVSVGVIRGGSAENVIPDEVYIEGTLRSFSDEVREALVREVERAASLTRSLGGDYRLRIDHGYPVLSNDAAVTGWIRSVGSDLLGSQALNDSQQTMGAEDFSYMTHSAAGAMFRLGVMPPGGEPRYLHTASFDLDEQALPLGSAMLAETALRFVRGLLVP